jgi:anti-sigma regulatory factor (Ser/Thr protein kinase)
MAHTQRLTVPGRFEQLARIAEFVTQAARDAGLGDDDVFHVEMAVDEACSNVIEHAYADRIGDIELTCASPAAGCLEVIIHDHGAPFDPDSVPQPKMGDEFNLDALQEGGLGLYFMRKLMDDVRFEFAPDHGNTLIMVKRKK